MLPYSTYRLFCGAGAPYIPEEDWAGVCEEASARVAYLKRAYEYEAETANDSLTPTERAICAVAETVYAFSLARSGGNAGGVSSLSVGSVKVGYGGASGSFDTSERAYRRAVYDAANVYLYFVRGVC